jgi:hypothetical protein
MLALAMVAGSAVVTQQQDADRLVQPYVSA